MKEKDEMFSVSEIFSSKKFERETPEGMIFLLRRFQRENERKEIEMSRSEKESKNKNVA